MINTTYSATCMLSKIGSIQEAAQIDYSVIYETKETCIIEVTKSNHHESAMERFRCEVNFCESIGLITFFQENCIYPTHCRDIALNLGYKIFSVT